MLEWHSEKPKVSFPGNRYLCAVVRPGGHGECIKDYRSLWYGDMGWECDDLIVVAWAEEPMWPGVTDFVPV